MPISCTAKHFWIDSLFSKINTLGFLKILEIPRGARHILIQEFKGSPHILGKQLHLNDSFLKTLLLLAQEFKCLASHSLLLIGSSWHWKLHSFQLAWEVSRRLESNASGGADFSSFISNNPNHNLSNTDLSLSFLNVRVVESRSCNVRCIFSPLAVKNQATDDLFLNDEGEFPETRSVIEKGVLWEYSNDDDMESVQSTGPLSYGVLVMVMIVIVCNSPDGGVCVFLTRDN